AGLTAGQSYAISFEVGAPFPSTALLQVLWGNTVIGTIDTSVSSGPLDHYSYVVTATGTPDDKITFREIATGDAPVNGDWQGHGTLTEDYQGTYLANVQAFQVAYVDEDGLNNPPDAVGIGDSQTGDAPGNNVFVSGTLGVSWGADNSDTPDGASQDGASTTLSGRNVVFTNNAVLINGTSSLTSHGEAVTFVLSENGT